MYGGKKLAIVVEHLTDGPVSGTIVTYHLGNPYRWTQNSTRLPSFDASLFSLGFRYSICHKDKDASFFIQARAGQHRPSHGSATETNEC